MEEPTVVPPEITDDDRLWALLGWVIPLVALIALLMDDKKNRPFVKYNAIQSLALAVVMIILSFIPFIGWLLIPVVWIYAIVLGVQSYNGKWVNVPVITDFAKKQGWI
jgi:uncharacterized membrane protein